MPTLSAGSPAWRAWRYRPKEARRWLPSGPSHVARECCLEIRMPARQGRAVLDDVAGRPADAPLIGRTVHFVVRTEDVEITGRQARQHEFDDLLGRPGPGGLLCATAGTRHAREDESRNQQVRAHPLADLLSQRVGERLGKTLDR